MKTIRLALLVPWLALSCGDGAPLGVRDGAAANDLLGGLPPPDGLLQCTPLPADSASETIGPEGGVLRVGPHALSVPPGALAVPVRITGVMPADTVNRVRFQPAGLAFARPAQLRMSYANCDLLGVLLPKRIAYTTDALQVLEYLLSFDNPVSRTVTGHLDHFSTYAVAW